jgi:uncharacterized protein YkwD
MTRRPRGRRLSVALTAVLLAVLAVSSAPSAIRASTSTDAESLAIDLINAQRVNAGLVPLRRLHELAVIAGTRAGRMRDANSLSHTVGGNIEKQLANEDVDWYSYGEAIGYSYGSWASGAARDLVKLWMNSSSHRALLMSSKFNYIGVGLAYRSSNHRTFGSVMLTESVDVNGARSWVLRTSTSGDDITWTWSGADLTLQTHTAGLRDYDVQYRVGSGSWVTARNDSTSTSFTLTNRTRGVTYGVHIRATDRRGNAGAWTKEYRVTLP